MKKITSMLLLAILSSCTIASNDGSIILPKDDTQRLIVDHLSLSTEDFFASYMSSNLEQRRLAEMYLIGVIDGSEGITWCGYEVASPTAIQEQVYLGLKEALDATPQRRASESIKLKLEQLLPCKDRK